MLSINEPIQANSRSFFSENFSSRITHFALSSNGHAQNLAYRKTEEIVRSAIRETIPPSAVPRHFRATCESDGCMPVQQLAPMPLRVIYG
jgi:hypothetical protein